MSRRRSLASVLCLGILLTGLTAEAGRLPVRFRIPFGPRVTAKRPIGTKHVTGKDLNRSQDELRARPNDPKLRERVEPESGIQRWPEPKSKTDNDNIATCEAAPLECSIWEPEPPLPGGARSFSELSSLPASTSPATPPDLASRGFLEHALRDVPAPAVRQVDGERARRREVEETEPWPGKLYRPCSEGGQGQSGSASRHGQGRAAATGC
ncbi:MAG TPA: hypothetical protein VNM90_13715 [Haliangium sp.]|nr:hypothetical protein [Haliangium sp.]